MNNIQKYYNLISKQKSLYYEDDSIGGVFNYEKIEIGICGIEERFFFNKIEKDFEDVFREYTEDEIKNQSISSFENIDDKILDGLKLNQILFHESLHVLQTFTLQSCNEHMYWIRNFRDLEFTIFSLNIMYKGKWSLGEKIIGKECEKWIQTDEKWIKKQMNNYGILQNEIFTKFLKVETKKIGTIDLLEGAAFAFQEVTTDSVGRNVFKPSPNSVYKKAINLYLSNDGENTSRESNIIFILMCHLSLKFGSSRYNDDKFTAAAIFEFLIDNDSNYYTILISSLNSSIIERKIDFLKVNDYEIKDININEFCQYSHLIDILIEDILSYFRRFIYSQNFMRGKEEQFYEKTVQHFDRKMKVIKKFLLGKYPLFESKYYIAILLTSKEELIKFAQCVRGAEILDLRLKSPNGREVSVEQDNFIFQLMNDFQELISTGETYCCEEHKITNRKRTILKCNNLDSLRMRIKALYGENFELNNLLNA